MRVVFVAPYLPTHGSGGRTRLINVMERLAKEHDLSLVAFTARDQNPEETPYPGEVLVPPAPPPRASGPLGALRFYRDRLDPLPQFAAALRDPRMTAAIRNEVARVTPDVVQLCTTEMGQYLHVSPREPVRALDLQDVSSRWIARVAEQGESAKARALMRLDLRKVRRLETRIARAADVVYVTSPIERTYLRELSGIDSVEAPNGVDTDAFVPMPHVPEERERLLFVGPLTSEANRDAIGWFARDVWPLVRSEEPDATLDVVGTSIDGLGLPEGIRSVGRVDDVREHLARAAVNVVPIRVASGTRYKILEALSAGRAVVSTSPGAEGLETVDGRHLLIADDAAAFARATVTLMRDGGLRARLGSAGREHVVARYDWRLVCERIEEWWARALETRRGG